MAKLLKTKGASVFVQPDGANGDLEYVGCMDVSSFDLPGTNTTTIRCINDFGTGWDTLGERVEPPGMATASLGSVQFDEANILDKLGGCGASLYINLAACGKRGVWGTYDRSWVLPNFLRTGRSFAGLAARETDSEIVGTYNLQSSYGFIANKIVFGRKTTTEAGALNDVWGNPGYTCIGDCGSKTNAGQYLVAPADSVGGATANIQLSTDGGATWAAAAADPFAAASNAMSGTIFDVGTTRRILVSMEGTGGAVQGMVAYSDDWGVSWTTVNIGGAAAGHGATRGGGLFALDMNHIWLAGAAGYIYFSEDGGASWVVQDAGLVTAGDYTQVHFVDKSNGMAVAAAGAVAITHNGGETWTAGGVVGAFVLNCVSVIDANRAWVGSAGGNIYYTGDGGTTWTIRTGWVGAGVGAVTDIHFVNDHVGWMLSNTAAPIGTLFRTINGGRNWEAITTPDNDGLNALQAIDENTCYVAGEVVNAGTAFIGKAEAI